MSSRTLRVFRFRWLAPAAGFVALLIVGGTRASAQCLTAADLQRSDEAVKGPAPTQINEPLRQELISMRDSVFNQLHPATQESSKPRGAAESSGMFLNRVPAKLRSEDAQKRFCEILKTYGFIGQSLVGPDGAAAALYLFKELIPIETQLKMLPVFSTAVDKKELQKNDDYAAFLDRLRVRSGMTQLYGTQAFLKDDLLVIAPIEDEQHVDERRAQYQMEPLVNYLKYLETLYRTAVIRERIPENPTKPKPDDITRRSPQLPKATQPADDDDEVIRVESGVVSLNVSVFNKNSSLLAPPLEVADFRVFENEQEEPITFFAKASEPFDLVLLLDLSGSTTTEQGLIRKAAKQFIRIARPSDRVSIVTFTGTVEVIVPLTLDHELLNKSVDKVKGTGRSHVWDGLLFGLQNSFGDKPPGRRRAIIMLSDGIDNTLTLLKDGSTTSFAELLDTIRRDSTIVIPIYVDTENKQLYPERMYRLARRTLAALADESGGQVYPARKLENLEKVYESVMRDLGTVYSLGYTPRDESRDGSWRRLRVEIVGHPDLIARTRPGYFANK